VSSSARAASLSVVFAAAITVWAELAPGLKNWLKDFSGHHWLSKSILMLVVYALGFAAFYVLNKRSVYFDLRKDLRNLVVLTVLGTAAILGFFVWHFLAA
jgi:hypothetical protein